MQNVLRDLQESPLGQKANQLESMTIEMVAMLFDFIFETQDLPDGIKALLARLQIPVLKAAMLDGAFFARKTHPSRCWSTRSPRPGWAGRRRWATTIRCTASIDEIVHRILDDFTDNLEIFDELREELEAFLADEEKAAEANIASTTPTKSTCTTGGDRRGRQGRVERRIESYPVPNFLAAFLRQRWSRALEHVYLQARRGERVVGARRWPRSRISSGACSRRNRRRTAGTWSRCSPRC